MNKKRLARLKEIMIAVRNADNAAGEDSSLFSIDKWVTQEPDNDYPELSTDTPVDQVISCGAICCALGWAATDPVLHAQGLEFTPLNNNIRCGRTVGFDAGAEFFGITKQQSYYLFDPDAYLNDPNLCDEDGDMFDDGDQVCPDHVIDRIEEIENGCEGRPLDEFY